MDNKILDEKGFSALKRDLIRFAEEGIREKEEGEYDLMWIKNTIESAPSDQDLILLIYCGGNWLVAQMQREGTLVKVPLPYRAKRKKNG